MQRTVYLIHHTHTDIGYTELQGRITDRQIDFIRQALRIADQDERFRWTCETFWAVEQFLKVATPDEEARFVEAVRAGQIGLSASYVNYSELLDYETHADLTGRARTFADAHGLPLRAAMTADINGHALGYAQALCDHGVAHLFACVHTYHGMYPLSGNQTPFYWRMPDGKRLLVWNGEHYHLGNELGLVPGAFMTHMVNDTVRPGEDLLSIAERRVAGYWAHLEAQGYPYSFVPLMVSGLMTDNGPPAPALTGHLERWNERHGDRIRIVLGTLETFFDALEASGAEIPEHEGLWPDWWVDLTVATPAAVQIFREGQRQLAQYRSLVERHPEARVEPGRDGDLRAAAEDSLALFAEHTFGHSGTYTHSDHLLVAACSYRKSGFAAEAYERAQRLVDRAVSQLGAVGFEADRPLRFQVMNPGNTPFTGPVMLELDQFEAGEVEVKFEPEGAVPASVPGFHAVDAETGDRVPSQAFRAPRGVQVRAWLTLEPGEARTLEVRRDGGAAKKPFIKVTPTRGIDGARDVRQAVPVAVSEHGLETPFVRIGWKASEGIVSWIDKGTGRELLDPERAHHAFTPVYEVSPGSPRTPMGRNRKGANVERTAGRLTGVPSAEAGDLFATALLDYNLPGTERCALLLRAYANHPLVEAEVMLHKETCQDVESLYLALPFIADPKSTLWIDAGVAPVRPWEDQLPGTLTDFLHLYDGWGSAASGFGVAIAMPDTPLLQLGDLAFKPRLLAGMGGLVDEPQRPYAWLMNNFWETNANIDLAGFYRFRYSVTWGAHLASPEDIVQTCRSLNRGPLHYRVR